MAASWSEGVPSQQVRPAGCCHRLANGVSDSPPCLNVHPSLPLTGDERKFCLPRASIECIRIYALSSVFKYKCSFLIVDRRMLRRGTSDRHYFKTLSCRPSSRAVSLVFGAAPHSPPMLPRCSRSPTPKGTMTTPNATCE